MKLSPLFEAMTKDKIQAIFKKNPDFFKNERYFKLGVEGGVYDFVLEMDPDRVDRYVDGDYAISSWTDKNGNKRHTYLFETILRGDTWDLWDSYSYDGDWEGVLDYYINEENENKLKEIINKIMTNNGHNPEDFNDRTLQDLINEYDDGEIQNALRSALSDAEADDYGSYLINQLKEACSEYGEVIKINDEGVHVKIDFEEFVSSIMGDDYHRDEDVIDAMERCDWDSECAFDEILDPYGDKPSINLDDRWHPTPDSDLINEFITDRLGEVEYNIGL